MAGKIKVPSELVPSQSNKIMLRSKYVYDDVKGHTQEEINAALEEQIESKVIEAGGVNWDTVPTAGSNNAVKSKDIKAALEKVTGYFVLDSNVLESTVAKTVTVADFPALALGGSIKIKMLTGNTANNPTLRIGPANATAYPLYYNEERAGANNSWEANEIISVFFDGTNYRASNSQGGSITKKRELVFGSGFYDTTNAPSQGAAPSSRTSNSNFKSVKVPVSEGDFLVINGKASQYGNSRFWATIDSSNNYVKCSEPNAGGIDYNMVIPEGITAIVINCDIREYDNPSGYYIKKGSVEYKEVTDRYLYGDLRTLTVGQNYEIDESVKTTDKQFRRITKEIKTLSLSEELAIGDIRTSSNATYRADDTINTYDPEGDYSEHPYALGSFAEYTYTVAAESVTAGNITVNGTEVAVEETDDAATVAAKIAAALVIDGWTTSVADNVITVRCNTIGNNTTTITINPDTENTGITVEESSVAGTNVIRKYDGESWANATVAGLITDGILAAVDEAWLIANATIQNTIVRDINWYASLDNKDGDFTWKDGNISNGSIDTRYANRYTIFNKNSLGKNVDSFTIYNGGISGKTFVLHYYNGSKYISIGNLKTGDNVINAIERQQFLILVWDKPTATQTANCSLRVFTEIKIKDVVEKHEERITDLENNLSVEDIHYSSELYKNADGDFTWKTGNPSNPQYPSVANKYFIVDVGRKINKLGVYKTTSSCYIYTCAVVGNSYIRILSSIKSANTTIDLSNYNYTKIYCLLYKDSGTPTTEEVLAENIELTFAFALDGELASLETRVSTLESSADAFKFTNPIIRVDNPDPAVWWGEDGYWYILATGNLRTKTMWRSANLIDWENTGETPFTQAAIETWAALGNGTFWAPEIVKVGDRWNMYLSATQNPMYVFTSKFPTYGFEYAGVIANRLLTYENIDACVRYDRDGTLWMFFDSCRQGMYRVKLNEDGTQLISSTLEHVAGLPDNAEGNSQRAKTYEGAYLYRRKGYWYLIVSAGNYNGSSYCLRVGRSATLDGTFVDKEGNLMTEGNATLLLSASGAFYGTGHNGSIITDKQNRTWMLFHSHWTGMSSNSSRPVCISEVLWDEDGWPYFKNNTLTASGIGPRM